MIKTLFIIIISASLIACTCNPESNPVTPSIKGGKMPGGAGSPSGSGAPVKNPWGYINANLKVVNDDPTFTDYDARLYIYCTLTGIPLDVIWEAQIDYDSTTGSIILNNDFFSLSTSTGLVEIEIELYGNPGFVFISSTPFGGTRQLNDGYNEITLNGTLQ